MTREIDQVKSEGEELGTFIIGVSEIIRHIRINSGTNVNKEREILEAANAFLRRKSSSSTKPVCISEIDAMFIYRKEGTRIYNVMGQSPDRFDICPAYFKDDNFGFAVGSDIGFTNKELGANEWFLVVSNERDTYFIPIPTLRSIQVKSD